MDDLARLFQELREIKMMLEKISQGKKIHKDYFQKPPINDGPNGYTKKLDVVIKRHKVHGLVAICARDSLTNMVSVRLANGKRDIVAEEKLLPTSEEEIERYWEERKAFGGEDES